MKNRLSFRVIIIDDSKNLVWLSLSGRKENSFEKIRLSAGHNDYDMARVRWLYNRSRVSPHIWESVTILSSHMASPAIRSHSHLHIFGTAKCMQVLLESSQHWLYGGYPRARRINISCCYHLQLKPIRQIESKHVWKQRRLFQNEVESFGVRGHQVG